MNDRLFAVPDVTPAEVPEQLSTDVRRRLKNEATIRLGRHPVTGRPLLGDGSTCGTCSHHVIHRHARAYHKCELNHTAGPGTDIRVSWPACTLFAPIELEAS